MMLLIIMSCNNNDDAMTIDEIEGIQIIDDTTDVLAYSPSPIDLNGLEVNFAKNISYGNNAKNTFDIFIPNSEAPTKLVIFIHGGGFLGGNKNYFYSKQESNTWNFPEEIRTLLSNNIAVATINYRILTDNDSEGIIKPLNDSKRCLQFLRSNADLINIDKTKIALYGVSAGAGASLWLNFHNDMAEPSNSDEVLQESTRVLGVVALETQATYDLVRWADDVFTPYNISFEELVQLDHARVLSFYGINSIEEIYSDEIVAYRTNVDMLGLMSSDDSNFWVSNIRRPVEPPTTVGLATHHAYHAKTLKDKADEIGIPNITYYGRNPILFEDPSHETSIEFLIRILDF